MQKADFSREFRILIRGVFDPELGREQMPQIADVRRDQNRPGTGFPGEVWQGTCILRVFQVVVKLIARAVLARLPNQRIDLKWRFVDPLGKYVVVVLPAVG